MLEAALAYHGRGFVVLPITKAKEPYIKWKDRYGERWLESGQTEDDVRYLFGGYERWGLGLLTHPYSDLLALDFDGPHSPDLWRGTGIELPLTTVHFTPSRLFHYLFRRPHELGQDIPRAVRLVKESDPCGWRKGCGVDLLSHGYVIVPPSPGYEDEAEVSLDDRAEFPVEILRLLKAQAEERRRSPEGGPDWVDHVLRGPIHEGERNAVAVRLIGHYATLGHSAEEIRRLVHLWAQSACKPPLNVYELQKLEDPLHRFVQEQRKRQAAGEALTQLWSADELVRYHGARLRFCPAFGSWYCYDERRWRRDERLEVQTRAKETVAAILAEAANEQDTKRRRALTDAAFRMQSRGGLSAMQELARDSLVVTPEEFDRDPWAFNCGNGTLDLQTGKLRPHDRGDLITSLSPVPFDPDAQAPRFLQFLDEILDGDKARVRYLQKALGYSLTADVREDLFFIMHGHGANGKSTLVRLLLHVLGDYGTVGAPDLFLHRRHESHPTDYADLFGKRFVAVMETAEGQRLHTAKIKTHTGRDRVKARFLYQDLFEFEPTYKVLFCTNYKPKVKESGSAMWRRLVLVPFDVEFPREAQDRKLGGKLEAEASGVLRWLVDGCLAWQAEGLEPPDSVSKATARYRDESDPVGRFLEEECERNEFASVTKKALFETFISWCDRHGEDAQEMPKRRFGDRLRERGFSDGATQGKDFWLGLKVRDLLPSGVG